MKKVGKLTSEKKHTAKQSGKMVVPEIEFAPKVIAFLQVINGQVKIIQNRLKFMQIKFVLNEAVQFGCDNIKSFRQNLAYQIKISVQTNGYD